MSDDNYTSLVGLLEEKAQKKTDSPRYPFLQGSAEEHNIGIYGELAEQEKIIALVLQKTMKSGECVIIIYPPGLDLIAAFLFVCRSYCYTRLSPEYQRFSSKTPSYH